MHPFDFERWLDEWGRAWEPGPPVLFDGILVADFAPDGRCQVLREWWNRPG